MEHSKIFLAVLHDIWEQAYRLKLESRRPDYLNAQTRFVNRRGGLSCRRRSDQLVGERRHRDRGLDVSGRGG